jgi:hypothetical protein
MWDNKEYKDYANITKGFTDVLNAFAGDDRTRTYDFWKTLRKANTDYLALDVAGDSTFGEFMLHEYGIQLYFDEDGQILSKFDIVDEKTYLFFVLKYS